MNVLFKSKNVFDIVHPEYLYNEYYIEYWRLIQVYEMRILKLRLNEEYNEHHVNPISIFGDNDYTVTVTKLEHKNLHKLLTKFTINDSLLSMKYAMNTFGEKITNRYAIIYITPLGDSDTLAGAVKLTGIKKDFLKRLCENDVEICDSKNNLRTMEFFRSLRYTPGEILSSRKLGFRCVVVHQPKERKPTKYSRTYKAPFSDQIFNTTQAMSDYYLVTFKKYIDRRIMTNCAYEFNDIPTTEDDIRNPWYRHLENPEQYIGITPNEQGWLYWWDHSRLFENFDKSRLRNR